MEVKTLLLLIGTGFVECQTTSSEDDQTSLLAVSSLAVAVALIIIVVSFMLIKDHNRFADTMDDYCISNQNADKQTPEPNVQVATENAEDVLNRQKAITALRGSLESFLSELKKTKVIVKTFPQSVRGLYTGSALGLPLKILHAETKKDALLYINGLLPLHSVVMKSIENVFSQYVSRDFEQWEQHLSVTLNDVRGFRQCCDVLLKLYMEIMVRVKKRQDQMAELKAELTYLTEEMERKKMEVERKKIELENSAKKKKPLNIFGRLINFIAPPLVHVPAKIDEERAEAERHKTKANRSALAMVNKTLIPFLDIFCDNLIAVAGSCKAIEQDILCFEGRNEKAMKLHQEMHYKVMKTHAIEIKEHCTAFLTKIRNVQRDFHTMHGTSLDRSNKHWLNRQLKNIKCNYPENITGQLQNMLSYFTDATSEQTAIEGNM